MAEKLITVTEGVELTCIFSFPPQKPVKLKVLPVISRVQVEGKWAANMLDCLPEVNIPSFGQCCSPANPLVLKNLLTTGIPIPDKCQMLGKWLNGSKTVHVGPAPALTMQSTCLCFFGCGVITIRPGTEKTKKTRVP